MTDTMTEDSQRIFLRHFDDDAAIADYANGPRRFTPGLDALHRMTGLLLAERAPEHARILVLGAGGGLELRALADAYPGWRFVGVDPAGAMLRLAARTVGDAMDRVDLIEGLIDDAPDGPFDGATCLLTLHFLPPQAREDTVRAIHRRLRPGAPFVAAHGSFPRGSHEEQVCWVDRYMHFAIASGADPEQARTARDAVLASGNMLSPEQDLEILHRGGFADAEQFYAAFTWRGWVGHA
ncbi:class I SAM-dependent methyltransferase [Sphingosinithalassobacter portus]|uniref:class I SAM-dependent methyltransferase n=1 Tax=Stakelama portus TaxID=2676234 RepID=UPI001EFCC560|nr:class I SAM-dependent methyltransferase [Sphingosinithalassobacter portus]